MANIHSFLMILIACHFVHTPWLDRLYYTLEAVVECCSEFPEVATIYLVSAMNLPTPTRGSVLNGYEHHQKAINICLIKGA